LVEHEYELELFQYSGISYLSKSVRFMACKITQHMGKIMPKLD